MNRYFPGIQRQRVIASNAGPAPPSTGGQSYSGTGLPAIVPALPSNAATYESLDLNVFFDWDTNAQRWRSRGQVKERTVLNLPANTWTRLPATTLLSQIDEYTVYSSAGVELDTMANRRSPVDGWPEIESLTAYTGLDIHCFGEITI